MKSVINISDSQFHYNTAVFGSGGAISSRSGTKINLTRVDVISNHADSFAGGLNLETGLRVILHNCKVNKNSARGNSGIASVQDGSLLIVKNTTFRENTCAHPDMRVISVSVRDPQGNSTGVRSSWVTSKYPRK